MSKPKSVWLLLGGETLAGKEIRELVESRKLPVTLMAASAQEAEHILSANTDDEAEIIQPLTEELLASADVVLLGGSLETNQRALALARNLSPRPAFVDLLGQFEHLPESLLRAPLLEAQSPAAGPTAIHTLAHPAALALARLLTVIHTAHPLRSAVVTLFEPASERGTAGVDELHKQALTLFNFQEMPRAVFDTQLAFQLLPVYGPESPHSLEAIELRIERHLASLLGPGGVPLPSLRLVQAPVFHTYTQSVWLEFESRPLMEALAKTLTEAGVEIYAPSEPLTNSAAAGQSGLAVSNLAEDRSQVRGAWLWLASDNLLTLAENALFTAGLLGRQGA